MTLKILSEVQMEVQEGEEKDNYNQVPLFQLEVFNQKNVSLPDRLTTQIHKWDLINGRSYVWMGATPNWTLIEALQQLEAIQHYNEYHGSKKQMLEYHNQLMKEIQDGIMIETDNIQIFNPTFLVPKPGGKQRKILDCRNINQLTTLLKFKMEGIEFIKQILEPSDFATTLDLYDTYHHIRVSNQLLPYFGFAFMGKTFAYRGLPFDYRNYPCIFNKTIYLAIIAIRKRRTSLKVSQLHRQHNPDSQDQGGSSRLRNVKYIHQPHSNTQLAMVFDIDGGIDAILEKKIDQNSNQKMDSSYQEPTNSAIERSCESDKRVEFSTVSVPECFIKSELIEFIEMLSNQEGSENRPRKLLELPLTATVTTDAAESGSSSNLMTLNLNLMDTGKWSNNWYLSNSNQLETAAVLVSLRSFTPILVQEKIKFLTLKTDNQTVEYLLRKQKGLMTFHIPILRNRSADALSRLAWRGDYKINPLILQEIMQRLQFYPQLDAFANRTTKQYKRYCSLLKDRKSEGKRGAFSIPWNNKSLLLHPPIEQIPKVLKKLKMEPAAALFILSKWSLDKFRTLVPMIIYEIDPVKAEMILEKGKSLDKLNLKLLLGNLSIPLLTRRPGGKEDKDLNL
ncbi:MAG: hypothetical protein EZS28_015052 [Streblomastix strix]|uniref:Reverse transcriptase domain-containing protein n=1 Tax=Streblomastix strix TaxID=222440 RepID=A0A5J4W4G7_9EUKA|nr:MAG: hypothetical protein EZS28_015052 [Streblomastix strix]